MTQPANSRPDSKRLVLVVGKGRSGTSLFAGSMARLGFHVPQPEIKADETNPRGFGEPRWVVRFHKRLMRDRRVTVFDSRFAVWERLAEVANEAKVVDELRSWLEVQFVGADNLVVKDPRIVWFLPLWRRCADELEVETAFVTMLRHPTEVVNSARRWYGTWQNDASRTASWINITLHTELTTRGSLRAFVRYTDLLDDWAREMSRCGELLGVPWLVDVDRSKHPNVEEFVDASLRRAPVGWDAVDVPVALQEMAEEVWSKVTPLARPGGDTENARAALDELRAAYVDFYSQAEAVAQSSVTAVKPRGGAAPVSAPGSGRASRPKSALRRLARVVPQEQKQRLVPRAVRESLQGSAGLPLLARLMLLVPLRIRERMPLPMIVAARRLARALRR
jgi:hypothetical protein